MKLDPSKLPHHGPHLRVLFADTDGRFHTWRLQSYQGRTQFKYEGALTKSELAALIIKHSPPIPSITEEYELENGLDLELEGIEI